MRGATCSVCGEAFAIPPGWRRDHLKLCPKHSVGDGDPRHTAQARRVRAEVLASNPPCHWCGKPATTVDHYPVPIVRGGAITKDNVVPSCERCNKSRGDRPGPPKGLRLT